MPIINLGSAVLNLADTVTSITADITYILQSWGIRSAPARAPTPDSGLPARRIPAGSHGHVAEAARPRICCRCAPPAALPAA